MQDILTLKSYSLFIWNSYVTDCPVVLLANSGAPAWGGERLELGMPGNLCLRPIKATQGSLLGRPVGPADSHPHGSLLDGLPLCCPPPLPLGLAIS